MKSNDLKRLLKTIQFKTEKTIEEIAGEIGYARAYLTDQVNKGTNESIRKVLTEKYGKYLEPNVSYNGSQKSLAAHGGQNSQKTSKDTDTLTTTTIKPDYGIKSSNGKDLTIIQAEALKDNAATLKSQQELISDLAKNVIHLSGKLIEKK